MELTNEFEVGAGVDRTWAVLTDIERIAPCLPGAQLSEVQGDEYRGTVKVKLGAIQAKYKGIARLVESDADNRRAVLEASGRDMRGAGNASATITATLEPAGEGTRVVLHTDLKVTGKVAQFGRGVMADVSAKLLGEFVSNLESDVLGAAAGPADGSDPVGADAAAPVPSGDSSEGGDTAAAPSPPPEEVRVIEAPEATPVDLLDVAGGSMLKRAAPAGFALVVVVVVLLWRRRRRR